MAMDGGKSRISSQSVSDRLLLKIGRSPVTGRAISCPVEEQLHRDLGRTSYALRDVGEGGQQGHAKVVSALIKQAKRLPDELYKSLTWDRGKELADHRRFTLATTSMSTSAIRIVLGARFQ